MTWPLLLVACALLGPLEDGYAYMDAGEYELAAACFHEAGDARELAFAYAALERHEDEIAALAGVPLDDPADHFNLVMALRDAGRPGVESMLRDVAWRTHPADELFPIVLYALAEEIAESDPEQAGALFAQVEYLTGKGAPHGSPTQDQAACPSPSSP